MAAAYRYGMIYERLQAHYPLLLHPDPQEVLVICLGTGTTLGSAGQYPVSRIDCVELSASVVAAGVCFTEETHNILGDPRVTVHVDDGRNYLLATTRTYDVITAEPMHPHLAGTVNLYTREYFRLVRDRLRPGGICSHWIPLHMMRPREVKTAMRAFRDVFPYTLLFVQTADAIIVGSDHPLKIDLPRWRRLTQDPRVSTDLEEVGVRGLPALLASYMMGDPALDKYIGNVPPVTDDLPTLEFFRPLSPRSPTQSENIRDILAQRDTLDQLGDHLAGKLSQREAAALERLYPLEVIYLRAYADYVSGNLRAAQDGFEEVLRVAPQDRRAEMTLNALQKAAAARQRGVGLSAPAPLFRSQLARIPKPPRPPRLSTRALHPAPLHYHWGTRRCGSPMLAAVCAALKAQP
jgi:hypothetical protein